MFFSETKLRQLANLEGHIKIEDIVNAINSIGFEVEGVTKFNSVENVKFGHVINTYKNPNSEKLTVCEIEFNDKKRTIQTAAKNVKNGDYLISFIPGSKLNDIEIKSKEMAGILSEGMLASFSELGFNNNLIPKELNDGILILDKIDLSLDPIKLFNLHDNIIEVSILSNRSDAQSYEIFSKELAAFFHTKHNNISTTNNNELFTSNIKLEGNEENKLHGIEIKNENFKLKIEDIFLLLKSNIKIEKNDFINFSNLTMIYTGVSLRAIDANKINEKLSIIEKDSIFYLNDSKNNVSILGVETLENFLPNSDSKNVFFEFSQINEKIVRDNSKKTKKVTTSSINNSRSISNGMIELAEKFISNHFKKCSKIINDIDRKEIKIHFNEKYLNDYAGFDITKKENYKKAIKSLEILDFRFIQDNIVIPNIRHDIKNMQNIVEEVFRFYNLNNFELSPVTSKPLIIDPINVFEKNITYLGYTQVWTYTLINKNKNEFNPFNFSDTKKLKTYVSEEYDSIRNSMALPLLNVFDYNFKNNIKLMSLFDMGMINDKKAIIIASTEKTYEEIKTDIEKITNQKFSIAKLDNDYLHPNYNTALMLSGKIVGWIGKFNPFKIKTDVDIIFAEILEEIIYKPKNKYIEFDNRPLKERDITFEINKDYELGMYLNALKSIDGLFSIKHISTYKKDNIDKITYKILMNENALNEFDKIDWTNKEKLLEI
ncbi:MAG: phenylalanine--tRNA ligase subunit beta [Mycoplasma sp.]|nr:phenylalanine--tRNA ligase subunit beta [Mycoplasma sp.]